ncbi:MAG TPA: carbamate kinase [Bacillota bacterium]|nr:carbamate kinase [Bacillota bacterium]HOK69863.1 carbamate kinase [Bacillota bacterium]HOL50804.1 carbamate kinase [Bacillota bacterium]HQD80117.1 carbamate kinase [Bacillota bacterium]
MDNAKTIVIALGGNAILQPGQNGTVDEQMENVDSTAEQVAELIAQGHRVVITHGNGPQVGALLIQQEAGRDRVPPMPLDVCGAESQGQIGYMLQQSIGKMLARRSIPRPVATVITQMVVDPNDPAFANPTKPVGPFYSAYYAEQRMKETGEKWIEDAGRGWRRVVPSPDPIRIVEQDAILSLVRTGAIVIANGGGGIPVIEKGGFYKGVEAVIDKDLGGECLARDVGADVLLILTDVAHVALHYKTPHQVDLHTVQLDDLIRYQQEGHFNAGSMGPKVEACRRFVERGGEAAIIAQLDKAVEAIHGNAGTRIVKQ